MTSLSRLSGVLLAVATVSSCTSPTEPGTVLRADGIVLLSLVHDFAHDLQWTPDGTEVLYTRRPWARERESEIYAVSLSTGAKRRVLPVPDAGRLGRVQVAANDWVYYSVVPEGDFDRSQIRRIQLDGSSDEAIVRGGFTRWRVSPLGHTILATDTAGRLIAITTDTGDISLLAEDVHPIVSGIGIYWSPDGGTAAVLLHAANNQVERLIIRGPELEIDRSGLSHNVPVWIGEAQVVWPSSHEPSWAFGHPRAFGLLSLRTGRWDPLPPPLTLDFSGTVRFNREGNWFVYLAWTCGKERRALFQTDCERSDFAFNRRAASGGPVETVARYSQAGYGFGGGIRAPLLAPDGSSLIYELDGELRLVAVD